MTLYVNPHVTQYDGSVQANANCTPATGANGANASSGGTIAKSGAQVRRLVRPNEETNPLKPGWSLTDLDLAMSRLGVGFTVVPSAGWSAVLARLDAGFYVALQGDSDQFGNATCSGRFDGDHCLGVHPNWRMKDGRKQRWIDDPICPNGRWEDQATLRAYAEKLYVNVLFGYFTTPVPDIPPAPPSDVDVIVPQRLGHVVVSRDNAHMFTDPRQDAELPTVIPQGVRLRVFGRVTGWAYVQINSYGDPPGTVYAWMPSSHLAPDDQPLTVIDGVCPPADCTAAIAAVRSQYDTRIKTIKAKVNGHVAEDKARATALAADIADD